MEYSSLWQPWIKFKKDAENGAIPEITEPPCKECKNFKPQRLYTPTGIFDGVQICKAESMHRDFSCFVDKP